MSLIHPTAIIHSGASIGAGTEVGPYSVIGPHVVLGKNNRIASHVVIEGHTRIGDQNQIFQFASVGAAPQDLKYHGEASVLEIGNQNIIREYVTLQPGTEGGGMLTKIGDKNLFMATTHIGHDCIVGNGNILANGAGVSGHVLIGNYVTIGGMCGIHQFTRLGDGSFLSGGTIVVKDIPPFCTAQGDRAGLAGINTVGMERRGYSADEVAKIRKLYRDVFFGEGLFRKRVETLAAESTGVPVAEMFLKFIAGSERGVTFPREAGGRSE